MTARATIGVDLGGTKMLVGVVDEDQRISNGSRERTSGLAEAELLDALENEIEQARSARPDVLAAGLGIPCTIDQDQGLAITAVNLPIDNVHIRDLMRERTGVPVYIDNDANCAAIAEHQFGVARGADDVVMLTIGTGIGGGLILDGEPYRGSVGAAAELGHVVVDADGPPCQGNCPNHGCVETLASGTALGREGRAAAEQRPDSALGRALAEGREIDGQLVTDAAAAGDEAAVEVMTTAGTYLGVALSSLANVFNPDLIVIGGGASAAGELLLGPARAELARRALPPMNETPVKLAELGPDAGLIGAATMALIELDAGR